MGTCELVLEGEGEEESILCERAVLSVKAWRHAGDSVSGPGEGEGSND